MVSKRALTLLMAVAAVAMGLPSAASADKPPKGPAAEELASFAAPGCEGGCGSGSTIGPDRALYVTDGPGGRVLRVDPKTGELTTFASGLPPAIPDVGIGGAMDIAFVGRTAYVLVTVVGPALGQPDVVNGIYRIGRHGKRDADCGHWHVVDRQPSRDGLLRPQRGPVRDAAVRCRVPRHRRPPQPRPARDTRRSYQRGDRVRQHRPHRPRRRWLDDLHGTGRAHPA